MAEQNRYQISVNYKSSETEEWAGWRYSDWVGDWRETGENWQDAIQEWLDWVWTAVEYTVVAETPSGDGKSGIIEIEFGSTNFWTGLKIQATPQRTDLSPS